MRNYYNDKVAVVTGAGSGIGEAIARLLSSLGSKVHCADINLESAQALAAELGNASAHEVDVTDEKAVASLAADIYAEDGHVDFLFNNAGIGHAALVQDSTLEDWRRVMEINVMGVVHGLHHFLPRMLDQGGTAHIINTASAAGLIALPRMAPYCASKHAVVGLSQSLAAELADTDIRVTILCPGIINTPIVKNSQMRGEAASGQAHAVEFYAKKGTSPDKVAADLLKDVRRGRLFCVTPRLEVGGGWLAQRISPLLAQMITRAGSKGILGLKD